MVAIEAIHWASRRFGDDLHRMLMEVAENKMTLSDALDIVYGHHNWCNPIHPYVVSGTSQTAYEAYKDLKSEFQTLVRRMIGHDPQKNEE